MKHDRALAWIELFFAEIEAAGFRKVAEADRLQANHRVRFRKVAAAWRCSPQTSRSAPER